MNEPISIVTNEDCMDMMKRYPDKYFELAVTDPPYNVGASDGRFGGKLKQPSMVSGKTNAKNYANHNKTPGKEYFDELFRISKNQIIFGSNYYPQYLYHSGAIVWDKKNDNNHVLSDCEIAFQSFNKLVKIYRIAWCGFWKEDESEDLKYRIHPNQKSVLLYSVILRDYAKEGDKILDTHLGSGSSRIAAYKAKLDFYGCELDKEYYEAQEKRFDNFKRQLTLDL